MKKPIVKSEKVKATGEKVTSPETILAIGTLLLLSSHEGQGRDGKVSYAKREGGERITQALHGDGSNRLRRTNRLEYKS